MKKGITDVLLVSFDYAQGDIPVMVVGRRENGGRGFSVLNAFKGDDAKDLYEMLLDGKEKYETAQEINS